MMRATLFLLGLCVASAKDKGECMINGARAVDDLVDSALFIWAATERCNTKLDKTKQDPIRCSLNIASAIESVNSMVNVILKAVEQCGHLEGDHPKCGMAVGQLTRAFAGLAASSSGIIAKCPNKLVKAPLKTYGGPSGAWANQGITAQTHLGSAVGDIDKSGGIGNKEGALGDCIINMKDTLKSLFKAMRRIMTVKENCNGEDENACAHNSLKIIASFAAIGEYIAGATGRCSANAKLAEAGECAEETLHLVRNLHNVGRASVDIHEYCEEGAERLYEIEHGIARGSTSSGSIITLGLAALLPLSAVASFMFGSRLNRRDESFSRLNVVATADAVEEYETATI